MLERDPLQQDLFLRGRLSGDVYRRCAFHRSRLERAGLGRTGVRTADDLRRLPPMRLDDVGSVSTLLMGGPASGVAASPSRGSGLTKLKTLTEQNRYWPARWATLSTPPLAYSSEDIETLGFLGKQILEMAGLRATDVVVGFSDALGPRDRWQLEQGCMKLGASLVPMPLGASIVRVDRMSPSAVFGEFDELRRLFEEASDSSALERIHTVILVGDVEPEHLAELQGLVRDQAVITRAWAPEGVFALWGQCRNGEGLHTWPGFEVVEVVDPLTQLPKPLPKITQDQTDGTTEPGLILWTGTAWYATAVLRLDTDAAARLCPDRCGACGRSTPRVDPCVAETTFAEVLDSSPQIVSWYAELQQRNGENMLVLYVAQDDVASSVEVLEAIDNNIGPAVVQIVDEDEVRRRQAQANGERYVDRRAAAGFE